MKSSEVRPQYFYIEGNGIRGGGEEKNECGKEVSELCGKSQVARLIVASHHRRAFNINRGVVDRLLRSPTHLPS